MAVPDIIEPLALAMVMDTVTNLPIMSAKPSSAVVCATTTMDMFGTVIILTVDIDIISTILVDNGILAADTTIMVMAGTRVVIVEDITADEKPRNAVLSINNFLVGMSPSPTHPTGGLPNHRVLWRATNLFPIRII